MSTTAQKLREQAIRAVQDELARWMPATETSGLMRRICEMVQEVDMEIDRILQDPRVSESWKYDGRCFVAKGSRFALQVVFDGRNILEWLQENLRCICRSHSADVSIALIMKEMDTFLWLAKVRRMNWEEEGHLGVLSQEVVQAVLDDVRERRRLAAQSAVKPMTGGESAFFKSYEEEMNTVRLSEN